METLAGPPPSLFCVCETGVFAAVRRCTGPPDLSFRSACGSEVSCARQKWRKRKRESDTPGETLGRGRGIFRAYLFYSLDASPIHFLQLSAFVCSRVPRVWRRIPVRAGEPNKMKLDLQPRRPFGELIKGRRHGAWSLFARGSCRRPADRRKRMLRCREVCVEGGGEEGRLERG